VIAKNYPTSLLRRFWPPIVRAQGRIAVEALKAIRGEAARARLRGQLSALVGIPRLLRKRAQTQKLRRVSDQYLLSVLSPID